MEDAQVERTFASEVFVGWEDRCEESLALPVDFRQQMSPRQLFEAEPLSHCDEKTKAWLGDLVHHLWLARYPVDEWVDQAKEKALEADETYQQIREALAECDDVRSAEALRPFRDEFAAFRDQC